MNRTPAALGAAMLAALALGGCASVPSSSSSGAAAAPANGASSPASAASAAIAAASARQAGTPGAGAAPPAPAPGQPPAFATVVKDATQSEGLFTLWKKDDKVWIELKPEDFDKPFFLSPKFATGIGESGLYGGLMASNYGDFARPQIVQFRRVHNLVQLIAPNQAFTARPGTPTDYSVRAAFSPSLVASASVASQPHPERKTVLVEANALFVADLMGIGMRLERTYRQNYGFDGRNSAITQARALPGEVSFDVLGHYTTPRIAVPSGAPTPGTPAPTTPNTLPDVRSLFMTVHYSLAKLPDEPMRVRRADPRVGYFQTALSDFSDDLARSPRVRYVNRWRLEKKDPSAPISEPVKPIVYWLDRSIPEKYRAALTAGILEWNKAFERIGFRNAIEVKVQPADADFDTLDFSHASVRWMTNASPTFGAIGPSHVDPRTGEILDADIGVESLSSRNLRAARAQILAGSPVHAASADANAGEAQAAESFDPAACNYADGAAEQLDYALDVLEARGEIDPDSPEAQQFVLDYLKDMIMHEVGHTLGLRHNFRASRVYSEAQLSDAEFTRKNANTGSVMEYAAINLPEPGKHGGTPFQATLGPYDYWAIEYGYKPIAPEQESAELMRIAARSSEPQLAYGTDEDNALGVDPESLQFDLGQDVVAFARKRFAIARDLFSRQETRELKPGADYAVLRRSVSYALRDLGRASNALVRQIGGVRTLRDYPGSGRDPLQPVPAAQQREALDVLSKGLLSADSFRLSPALQRRLAPDYLERTDAVFAGGNPGATDYSLGSAVIELQRSALSQLMSDSVAARLLDSEGKAARRGDTFTLSELYARLDKDVWSELSGSGDIPALRRELQRDYVNRLANLMLRPGALSRADARSLLRVQAHELASRLSVASRRTGLSPEARAHLQDSADTLNQALAAKLMRAGT